MRTSTSQQKVIENRSVPTQALAKPKLNVVLKVVRKPVSPGAFDC